MSTLSLPQLSLNLPSTRMSVNFNTFVSNNVDPAQNASPNAYPRNKLGRKPLPSIYTSPRPAPLPPGVRNLRNPNRYYDTERALRQFTLPQIVENSPSLSRSSSNGSSTRSTSSSSTISDRVFTQAPSPASSRSASPSSVRSKEYIRPHKKGPFNLLGLPQPVVEKILSYVVPSRATLAIGLAQKKQYQRGNRRPTTPSQEISLGQALQNPIFSVSRRVRRDALTIFYQQCEVQLDLMTVCKDAGFDDNLNDEEQIWDLDFPTSIQSSLKRVSKISLKIPVPSLEAAKKEGEALDMKTIRRAQENATNVQECLDDVVQLLQVLREPHQGGWNANNSTLQRLEVTLVKRSASAVILPDTLGIIRTLRLLLVNGYTKYYLALEDQKTVWATKLGKEWQGKEPDGKSLLKDLQDLKIAVETPKKSKKRAKDLGKLDVSPSSKEKRFNLPSPDPRSMFKNPLGLFGKSGSANDSPSKQQKPPPSIDELKQIAEDIRNGVY